MNDKYVRTKTVTYDMSEVMENDLPIAVSNLVDSWYMEYLVNETASLADKEDIVKELQENEKFLDYLIEYVEGDTKEELEATDHYQIYDILLQEGEHYSEKLLRLWNYCMEMQDTANEKYREERKKKEIEKTIKALIALGYTVNPPKKRPSELRK